ncbi:MAG: hypothetical protein CM15mP47_3450 [Methanobacteriota archaeon]|nr:MAG: hypothetical protein CM15mP47_3450 [Euryarchaeota archaeon]
MDSIWQAPAAETGVVDFWITGNSVNGDQGPGPEDKWNQLILRFRKATKNYSNGLEPICRRRKCQPARTPRDWC